LETQLWKRLIWKASLNLIPFPGKKDSAMGMVLERLYKAQSP